MAWDDEDGEKAKTHGIPGQVQWTPPAQGRAERGKRARGASRLRGTAGEIALRSSSANLSFKSLWRLTRASQN